VLSGRGLCDELITRPEEFYRLWYVVVCDLETSRMRRPWLALGRSATEKKNIQNKNFYAHNGCFIYRAIKSHDKQFLAYFSFLKERKLSYDITITFCVCFSPISASEHLPALHEILYGQYANKGHYILEFRDFP